MHHQSARRTGPPASKPRSASPPHDHADAAAAPGDNAIAPAPGTDSRMRTHRPIATAHTAAVLGSDVIVGLAIGAAPNGNMRWWLVPEAQVTGTGTWPAASKRRAVARRSTGASGGRMFQRQPYLVPPSPGCSRAASGEPAHDTPGGTPPFPGTNISPGGTAVTGDDGGIVNVRTRGGPERHRACHPRVRLPDALPGRARQQQVSSGRGLARLHPGLHDPGRQVQLSSHGRGELQRVQSRPAARRAQGMPARWVPAPAPSR